MRNGVVCEKLISCLRLWMNQYICVFSVLRVLPRRKCVRETPVHSWKAPVWRAASSGLNLTRGCSNSFNAAGPLTNVQMNECVRNYNAGLWSDGQEDFEARNELIKTAFWRTSHGRPAARRSCGTLPLVGELRRETQVQSGRGVVWRWAGTEITGIWYEGVQVCGCVE